MFSRTVLRCLPTRPSKKAQGWELGDGDILDPVMGGVARCQKGLEVQAVEPVIADDEDAIAGMDEVFCWLYQHFVQGIGRGMLIAYEVFGGEDGAPVVCHQCEDCRAIWKR